MIQFTRRALVISGFELYWYGLLIALAILWFVPIYYLIVTPFKTPQDATNNPLALPEVWVFENYVSAWNNMQYPRALGNTVFITVCSVFLVVMLGGLAGYGLALRKAYKSLEGMNGDISGYALTISELCAVAVLAVL